MGSGAMSAALVAVRDQGATVEWCLRANLIAAEGAPDLYESDFSAADYRHGWLLAVTIEALFPTGYLRSPTSVSRFAFCSATSFLAVRSKRRWFRSFSIKGLIQMSSVTRQIHIFLVR